MTETVTVTMQLQLRFFASARAAIGAGELSLELGRSATIADALDAVVAGAPGTAAATDGAGVLPANTRAVLDRCSFLVNGIATTDRGRILADGDLVDVLPPFAGG